VPLALAPPVDADQRAAPGLYLAGDIVGAGLIRRAIEQGVRAAHAVANDLRSARRAQRAGPIADLAVIGAGPAGLGAALTAASNNLAVVVLEQGSVAESLQSFPRGKIVLDADPDATELPLWLAECQKEDLIARWLREVRRARLDVRELCRVEVVERHKEYFRLLTIDASGARVSLEARRLVVAIGRRGTPKKLSCEIPENMRARVHYALFDARSFAGRRVVIVGLGDVAMEAALALSDQPGSDVTLSYRRDAFRRGKQKNIEALRRKLEAGRVRIVWQSRVSAVMDGAVVLTTPHGEERVPCDVLFVLIGAPPARSVLAELGLDLARPTTLP
jgi:thioredoxin reductase